MFRGYINFYEAKVADDVIDLAWKRLVDLEDGFLGLVAVDEHDRPIGIAHVLFHPSTWSPTAYCYLEDLFVDRGARRHGVGRALIKAVYEEAEPARRDAHLLGDERGQQPGAPPLRPRGCTDAIRPVSPLTVLAGASFPTAAPAQAGRG
ncbi:MAG: GNAT family N-acetyltransferase, partial [Hyphomicrobium sp.]